MVMGGEGLRKVGPDQMYKGGAKHEKKKFEYKDKFPENLPT